MNKALSLIRDDIKRTAPAFISLALYCILAQILFHRICPFVLLTGFPCPACGISRAFVSMITGQWQSVVSYNLMVVPWVLMGVYFITVRYFIRRRTVFTEILLCIVCLLTFAYYIYRMIFVFPSGPVMTYHDDNLLYIMAMSG